MRRIGLFGALAGAESELAQALAVLRAGGIDRPESLSLGEGDRQLLELHRRVTGRELELVVTCPSCGTGNSVVVDADAVGAARPRVAVLGAGGGLREPRYTDLVGLPSGEDDAVAELLRRCVTGAPARAPEPEELDLVDDSLAGPLAVACVECEAAIEATLDVERAVLESLQRDLDDLELEVHLLARAYHWELAAIEALPDARRTRLAELVADGR